MSRRSSDPRADVVDGPLRPGDHLDRTEDRLDPAVRGREESDGITRNALVRALRDLDEMPRARAHEAIRTLVAERRAEYRGDRKRRGAYRLFASKEHAVSTETGGID